MHRKLGNSENLIRKIPGPLRRFLPNDLINWAWGEGESNVPAKDITGYADADDYAAFRNGEISQRDFFNLTAARARGTNFEYMQAPVEAVVVGPLGYGANHTEIEQVNNTTINVNAADNPQAIFIRLLRKGVEVLLFVSQETAQHDQMAPIIIGLGQG